MLAALAHSAELQHVCRAPGGLLPTKSTQVYFCSQSNSSLTGSLAPLKFPFKWSHSRTFISRRSALPKTSWSCSFICRSAPQTCKHTLKCKICEASRENEYLLALCRLIFWDCSVFVMRLTGAALFQLTREYFTKELKRHYQGYNNTDVFTSTWNAIMSTVRPRHTWNRAPVCVFARACRLPS